MNASRLARLSLLLLLLLIALSFSACSGARPLGTRVSVPAITHPLERPPLPDPVAFSARPVEFTEHDGALCLTPQAYENLARNLADLVRWVQEARARLDYYGDPK